MKLPNSDSRNFEDRTTRYPFIPLLRKELQPRPSIEFTAEEYALMDKHRFTPQDILLLRQFKKFGANPKSVENGFKFYYGAED